MDFGFSPQEESFGQQVRLFLREEVTSDLVEEADSGSGWGPRTWDFVRKLGARRWLAPTWPRCYGGLELAPVYRFIIHEELCYARALPEGSAMVGAAIAGPIIMSYGSEKQRLEYLPRIAGGEIEFALGYTEPRAGTDLANIEMHAEEKEERYVLNGQKVFSTRAHFAQYHWVAARTARPVPKHTGLSLFIVDLTTPGITARPIRTLGGLRTNEVFYDNVVIPKENLVGDVNRGFYYLMTALEFERVFAIGGLRRVFDDILEFVKARRELGCDLVVRQSLAELAIEIEIARLFVYRVAWLQKHHIAARYEAAALKLFASELSQRLADCGMRILGLLGLLKAETKKAPLDGRIERLCRETMVQTIAGGTSEMMRNIIATRGLGLPRFAAYR